MPRQDHDDLNGNPATKREHPSDAPRRPRSAVGSALMLHEEEIRHCESLFAETHGEVTDETEAAEARRDLSARQALEALAHHRHYLDDRKAMIAREREHLAALDREIDKRIEWNEGRTADLAETVAPERSKIQLGTRTIKLRRSTAVVTGESYDVQALPPAWVRHVPEHVSEAYDVIDKAAAKADMLLGYREGEPPGAGWYDVEGHGRAWLCPMLSEERAERVNSWTIANGPDQVSEWLADRGLSIEPEPGLDVLRWKPSPPGVALVHRTHVSVK